MGDASDFPAMPRRSRAKNIVIITGILAGLTVFAVVTYFVVGYAALRKDGVTFHEAAGRNDVRAMRIFNFWEPVDQELMSNLTPLMRAVQVYQFEGAEWLLAHGADINFENAAGQTALIAAIDQDAPGVVEWLLEHGADPSIPNSNGLSALAVASKRGNRAAVELLLAHGATPNDVLSAVYRDDHAALRRIAEGRTLGEVDGHFVGRYGTAETVRILLESGAKLTGPEGAHALRIALRTGQEEKFDLLWHSGARLNPRDHRCILAAVDAQQRGFAQLMRHYVDLVAESGLVSPLETALMQHDGATVRRLAGPDTQIDVAFVATYADVASIKALTAKNANITGQIHDASRASFAWMEVHEGFEKLRLLRAYGVPMRLRVGVATPARSAVSNNL